MEIVEAGKTLYFFPNVKNGGIMVSEIDELLDSLEEKDGGLDQVPYQSTIMTTNEYGTFIDK